MPKVPGVTRDLLQKQILELFEGLGIPAKEWVGKGGSKVKRLVTKTGISPFKRDLLGTLSQEKKTFGDALDVFQNEAKFIMNANDQELMNFKNNLTEYTSVGGKPRGPKDQGLGSMMKELETSLKDLEKSANDLMLSSEEAKAFSKEMMDDALETAKYGGDPFKVPDKKSFGGSMYAEGNMRTALREFLQTEFKNGRLNLNKNDQFRVMNYSPMSEDDPILVFKKIYGDNSTKKVEEIVNVFEKGESFKHYEQLLRENVDTQFLKPLNQADVGDGKLVLTEAEEIKPKLPDDDDIPFNLGGRVGLKYGTRKLFNFTKKQLLDAVNDIFPTGDRKYDAEMVGDALVENNPKMFQNRLRQDLNDSEYSEIYGIALDALDAFNAEARKLMKDKKGVGSLIKKVNEEFGEGTAKRASDLPKGTKYEELEAIKDFEARNPIEKSKGQIWKDEKGETDLIAMGGFSESEMAGLDKAFIKGKALSDAMKKMGYDTSSGKETLKFDEVVSQGMEGFPAEIKEQVIRAKYGDIVDQRLLDNLIGDTDPQHLSFVMGTIDEGLKMQEMGMGPDEILQSIKDSLKRQPQALGGGVGSMFRGV